jgi:hypothetical protein
MIHPRPGWGKTHQHKQAACSSPPLSRSAQSAAPTALRQGGEERSPLTVLVYAASVAQRDGSGGSRLTQPPWAFLIVAMSKSNCH